MQLQGQRHHPSAWFRTSLAGCPFDFAQGKSAGASPALGLPILH